MTSKEPLVDVDNHINLCSNLATVDEWLVNATSFKPMMSVSRIPLSICCHVIHVERLI